MCEARWGDCQRIGVHAHHRRLRSQGGGHDSENLLWVCPNCHVDIHANPAQAIKKGHILLASRA